MVLSRVRPTDVEVAPNDRPELWRQSQLCRHANSAGPRRQAHDFTRNSGA